MSEPPIDIWPILQRAGITITQRADGWLYSVPLKNGGSISGTADTAEAALEEALKLLIGYASR